MLQSIRERAKGWFAYLIVILIAIPFAFWGIYEYRGGGAEQVAAVVNGREISTQELQRAYQRQRDQLRQMFGGRALPAFLDESTLKRQAVDQLVRETLVYEAALRLGYGASDEQVASTIASFDAFKNEGRFDSDLYDRRLRLQGYSPEMFEAQVRQSIISQQIAGGIQNTVFVTASELAEVQRLERQEREILFLRIPVKDKRDAVEVTDAQIQEYYDGHPRQFDEPERLIVEYLELKISDLGRGVTASEEELQAMYEERREQLIKDEERRARHILIALEPDAAEEDIANAEERARDLRAQLADGAAFEELAEQNSDDPGSAQQGGDLDFFNRGVMVPAFDEWVFAQEPGALSDPIRTEFGFHIIEVTDIRAAGEKTFDEVRADLLQEYQARVAEQQFYDQSEELANLTYEQPDTLEAAADAMDLEILVTLPFSRDAGEDVAANPKFRQPAFSPDVLDVGNNSEVIEITPDHLVVLRVRERIPAQVQELDAVRDAIVEILVQEGAQELAREQGQALAERLNSVDAFREVAAEQGLTLEEPGFVRRDAPSLDAGVRTRAFSLPEPAEDSVRVDRLALANGDYVVLALTAIRDGVATEAEDATTTRDRVRLTLQNAAGQSEWQGLVQSLQEKADVKINEEAL